MLGYIGTSGNDSGGSLLIDDINILIGNINWDVATEFVILLKNMSIRK